MICADFLAEANLENDNPGVLLKSMVQCFKFLPDLDKQALLEHAAREAS